MILFAIVRLCGLRFHGTPGEIPGAIWFYLWQQIEACVAVTMLSLTAFRSFFIGARPRPNQARPWVPSTARVVARRQKRTAFDHRLDDLPLPSATLTGFSQTILSDQVTHLSDEEIAVITRPLSIRIEQGRRRTSEN